MKQSYERNVKFIGRLTTVSLSCDAEVNLFTSVYGDYHTDRTCISASFNDCQVVDCV